MTAAVVEPRPWAPLAGAVAAVGLPLLLLGPGGAVGWWAAALAVAAPAAVLAWRRPDLAWWLAVAAAPLSVEVPLGLGAARVAVPVEPLMGLALLAWAAHRWRPGATPAAVPWRHPLVLLAAAVVAWTVVAAAVGTAPAVGLKLATGRGLQAAVFLGVGLTVLRRPADTRLLALVGGLALAPVVLLAGVRVALAGFERDAIYASAAPFFPNRLELTLLAAFWLLAGLAGPPDPQRSRRRWLASLAAPAGALLLLHGRAGWLCLAVGLAARALVALRPRPAAVAAAAAAAAVGFGACAADAARWWDQRAAARAAPGPLDPLWQGLAVALVDGDRSTLERLNRWRCALAMAAERPPAGFGPGAFESSYGRFQRASDLTSISTFAGDLGDAHSQPLGTLAEQGLVGLALELTLLAAALAVAARTAWRSPDRERLAATAAWAGALAGLAAAGLFAGWSDLPATGPAAWLAIAVLVRLDAGESP